MKIRSYFMGVILTRATHPVGLPLRGKDGSRDEAQGGDEDPARGGQQWAGADQAVSPPALRAAARDSVQHKHDATPSEPRWSLRTEHGSFQHRGEDSDSAGLGLDPNKTTHSSS